MKKILVCALVLALAAILSACGVSEEKRDFKTPEEAEIISLINKAEAAYQMGNTELFEILSYENMIGDGYYDEIANYEEMVNGIFTEEGRAQLEETTFVERKIIVKENDKIYKASAIADSARTRFYDNINEIKLVEQNENVFTYEITHVPVSVYGNEEEITSVFVIANEGSGFLVESFEYPLYDN